MAENRQSRKECNKQNLLRSTNPNSQNKTQAIQKFYRRVIKFQITGGLANNVQTSNYALEGHYQTEIIEMQSELLNDEGAVSIQRVQANV